MRLPVKPLISQRLRRSALVLLATSGIALGTALAARDRAPTAVPATGPAADYPVIVGEPFTVGGTVWTPSDQLNYDAVGLAGTDEAGLTGVTAAHKTLPLPSYVEITALDSGRTILVRLEKRGPMVNDELVGLSADAAAQLGVAPGSRAPVRVRRVNPPEQERAMLRNHGRVPERMETPEGLLKVLRRKLADQSPLAPPPSVPPAMPKDPPALPAVKAAVPASATTPSIKAATTRPATPSVKTPPVASVAPVAPARAKPAAPTPVAVPRGNTVVQVGAFASEANARALAARLGGQASRAGKLWRVRLGPYESRAKAAPALEKARRAGYTDARIQNAD